ARASVGVTVGVELHAYVPVGIELTDVMRPETGPAPGRTAQEDARQPAGQLLTDLPERQRGPRAGRALHAEVVSVVVVEPLQRFDDQEVDREPHGSAPVGVAAEQPGRRLA